jgi:hypothetical protein
VPGMAYLFKWELAAATAEVYDQVMARLEAAGAGLPQGRLYHVCYGPPERIKVAEVWASTQLFHGLSGTLVPILKEHHVEVLEPDVWPVYNITRAQQTAIETTKCLLAKFDPPSMTPGQYNEIVERLSQTGYGEPSERLYQVCYHETDGLHVLSIWNSAAAYLAFFDTLVHVALNLVIPEVPFTEVVVEQVHNIIDGSPLLPGPHRAQPD